MVVSIRSRLTDSRIAGPCPVQHAGDGALGGLAGAGRADDRHRRHVTGAAVADLAGGVRPPASPPAFAVRRPPLALGGHQPPPPRAQHEPARQPAADQQRSQLAAGGEAGVGVDPEPTPGRRQRPPRRPRRQPRRHQGDGDRSRSPPSRPRRRAAAPGGRPPPTTPRSDHPASTPGPGSPRPRRPTPPGGGAPTSTAANAAPSHDQQAGADHAPPARRRSAPRPVTSPPSPAHGVCVMTAIRRRRVPGFVPGHDPTRPSPVRPFPDRSRSCSRRRRSAQVSGHRLVELRRRPVTTTGSVRRSDVIGRLRERTREPARRIVAASPPIRGADR